MRWVSGFPSTNHPRRFLKLSALAGAVVLTTACAVVPAPPPPAGPYYAPAPYIYSYPDYPPYYSYYTGPSIYFGFHDDGFHHGRGYYRGRR